MNNLIDGKYVVDAAKRTEPDYEVVVKRLSDPKLVRLLHAAMGMATEVAEFIDQLKKHIFYGKPLDTVNLKEELGDNTWYERIAVDELETTLFDIYYTNIEKLKARFPDKFSEESALDRDLAAEREILER